MITNLRHVGLAILALGVAVLALPNDAGAQRKLTFAYDQPKTTGYGFAGDLFEKRLGELSKGTLKVDQFPGAQLGQEPVVLQKLRSGDIDFIITSTANASTVAPQAGVFSLHFIFRDEAHLAKAVADPDLVKAFKEFIGKSVQGAHALALITLGFRNMYGKSEINRIEDVKGKKVACRPPRPRTRSSRPMAPRPSTCRLARSIPRCKPAWSISPRTA